VTGAIRSQPRFEETGAVSYCEEAMEKSTPAALAAMKSFTRLTPAG
jgi:hypothetical protein